MFLVYLESFWILSFVFCLSFLLCFWVASVRFSGISVFVGPCFLKINFVQQWQSLSAVQNYSSKIQASQTGAGGKPSTRFPPKGLVELAPLISNIFWIFKKMPNFCKIFQLLRPAKFLQLRRFQTNLSVLHISKRAVVGGKIAYFEMSSFECNTFQILSFRY